MSEPGSIEPVMPEVEPPSGQEGATAAGTSDASAGSAPRSSRLRATRSRLVAALVSIPGMSRLLAGSSAEPEAAASGRSRLAAALLSFVWPGLGQLYARRFITAAIFAVPVVLAAVWLVMQVLNGVLYFGASFLDDSFALTFVIGGAFLGVWRIVSMIHAYATTGPRRRPRRLDAGVLAVLLIVVLAVHGEVVYYAWSAYSFDVDLTNNVLVNNQPTAAPSSQPSATLVPTPAWQPSGSNAPSSPTPGVSPSPAPSDRVTILLTGMDWMPGRTTAMNDAIMLVSLDTETNKVTMVSIPRDTADFDYYWGGSTGVNTKINNFANLIGKGLIHAPDPPLTAFANEVGYLVGVKVDYYAEIDMSGFGSMVNLLPGHDVCVYNPKAIDDPSTQTHIAAGNVCLDGVQAIKYVRSRHNGGSDYVRAGRQQQNSPGGGAQDRHAFGHRRPAQPPVVGGQADPDQLPAQDCQELRLRRPAPRGRGRHAVRARAAVRLPPGHRADQGRLDESARTVPGIRPICLPVRLGQPLLRHGRRHTRTLLVAELTARPELTDGCRSPAQPALRLAPPTCRPRPSPSARSG